MKLKTWLALLMAILAIPGAVIAQFSSAPSQVAAGNVGPIAPDNQGGVVYLDLNSRELKRATSSGAVTVVLKEADLIGYFKNLGFADSRYRFAGSSALPIQPVEFVRLNSLSVVDGTIYFFAFYTRPGGVPRLGQATALGIIQPGGQLTLALEPGSNIGIQPDGTKQLATTSMVRGTNLMQAYFSGSGGEYLITRYVGPTVVRKVYAPNRQYTDIQVGCSTQAMNWIPIQFAGDAAHSILRVSADGAVQTAKTAQLLETDRGLAQVACNKSTAVVAEKSGGAVLYTALSENGLATPYPAAIPAAREFVLTKDGVLVVLSADRKLYRYFNGVLEQLQTVGTPDRLVESDGKIFFTNASGIFLANVNPFAQAPKVVSFTADPPSILPGQTATLRWVTEGAVSGTVNPMGTPIASAASGSLTVTPNQTTTYQLEVRAANGAPTVASVRVEVRGIPVDEKARITRVLSATGNTQAPIAPLALFTIEGENLCGVRASGIPFPGTQATSLPLPTEVGRCRVRIGTRYLPMMYGATLINLGNGRFSQINAQWPADLGPGTYPVTVERLDFPTGKIIEDTATTSIVTQRIGPALFANNESAGLSTDLGQAVIMQLPQEDWQLATAQHAATPGSLVVLYGTGFGSLDADVPAGQAPKNVLQRLARPQTPVTVFVKAKTKNKWNWHELRTESFAQPDTPGLGQLNATIDDDIVPDDDNALAYLTACQEQNGEKICGPEMVFVFRRSN